MPTTFLRFSTQSEAGPIVVNSFAEFEVFIYKYVPGDFIVTYMRKHKDERDVRSYVDMSIEVIAKDV